MSMKNRIIIFLAALIAGLLFYCPKTYACYGEYELLPEAGFSEFLDSIEIEPGEELDLPEAESACYIEPTYILTDREVDLLLRVAVLEGGETNTLGMGHVMQVVLNRVASDNFPNTIEEVIFQTNPRQFATAEKLATANITPEAWAALDSVIFGDFTDNHCLYFESEDGLSFDSWATYVFSFGGHDFYM